ncbi:hypothetical protein MO867_03220 [Microbulbifer sp. OS29]|uniref:DUF7716 domain-containing protein n=1 Tax=Microbulbifer okhotskensis TaxID=2926617 RepID=A0A9X2J3R9_9GAMM|nr:hypothetical protein [Microbulbifer okhotskensis]MCO1333343.1 hypothetical protein [Microbulbifer okhotskensis]
MEPLINILKRASEHLEEGWLYLPKDRKWNLDTPSLFIDIDALEDNEVDEDDEPLIAQKKGLISILDSGTIEDIASFAKRLKYEFTDDLLLESLIYYYDHDAFLPHPGFKPNSSKEQQGNLDRDFYDQLGLERESIHCKSELCPRGTVKHSVYCKPHHFEMTLKKPCPFMD